MNFGTALEKKTLSYRRRNTVGVLAVSINNKVHGVDRLYNMIHISSSYKRSETMQSTLQSQLGMSMMTCDLISFSSISGRCDGDNERLCAMEPSL